jgi:hypothetical protein
MISTYKFVSRKTGKVMVIVQVDFNKYPPMVTSPARFKDIQTYWWDNRIKGRLKDPTKIRWIGNKE